MRARPARRDYRPDRRGSWVRRVVAYLLTSVTVVASPLIGLNETGGAAPDFSLQRIAGANRIATAVEISMSSFLAGADAAVLVRADLFPDGLSATYLAGQLGWPVLLTPSDRLPAAVEAELSRLGVSTVFVVGGAGAVSKQVTTSLTELGYRVERISSSDRYSTASAVATASAVHAVGLDDLDRRTAILGTGENFADVLAAGPLSFASHFPILLTRSTSLPASTASALSALDIEHVLVLGGPGAVAEAVTDAIVSSGRTFERLAGTDRYSTAVAIGTYAIERAGFSRDHVNIATGAGFPDALASGPHGGTERAVTLLTAGSPTPVVCEFLQSIDPSSGHVLGGPGAVSAAAAEQTETCGRQSAPQPGIEHEVTVQSCQAELFATLDVDPPVLVEGHSAEFDVTLRNSPIGPCLMPGSAATVVGAIRVPPTAAGVEITGIVMWLRSGSQVLPAALGLSSVGTVPPEACPGGAASGCGSEIQGVVGNVDFPVGLSGIVQADASRVVPFRYFPSMDAVDLTRVVAEEVELVVAVRTADAMSLSVTPVQFVDAPEVQDMAIELVGPGLSHSTVAGALQPGEETYIPSIATYAADPDVDDRPAFTVNATGSTLAGSVSATDSIELTVAHDDSLKPSLSATAVPDVIEAGTSTSIVVAVRARGDQSAPPVVTPVVDGIAGPAITLSDDGLNGDLAAGDAIYSTTVSITALSAAVFEAQSVVDGVSETSQVAVSVVPVGTPLVPTTNSGEARIVDPATGAEFAADLLVVFFDDEVSIDDVSAVAAGVGGDVAGRVSATTWQIRVPVLADLNAFQALAAQVASMPHVVDVALESFVESELVQPNDPSFSGQWHHATIHTPTAWMYSRGAGGGVLAVIDSGVDLQHSDLNVSSGHSLVADPSVQENLCGHGTHVAGIAGARSNNGVAVAGVAWGAPILAVRVFSDDSSRASGCSSASDGTVAAGIRWAVDRGARVINLSLGGPERRRDVAEALEHAWLNDVVVVAAAGNDGLDTPNYPASYERLETFTSWFGLISRTYRTDVIAVGATDPSDQRAPFSNGRGSNFGSWVDVAAPGSNILSTVPGNNGVGSKSGTSMATPVVSGVAHLLRSLEPGLSTTEIRHRLVSTGIDIGEQQIGPRVDAYAATFNGGFEAGISGWTASGDARTVRSLGPIRPQQGKRMAFISTGPGESSVRGSLNRWFDVNPELIQGDSITVSFLYNYVTEEYPEYVGSQYNDQFRAVVRLASGQELVVAQEEVNTTAWTPISGIDFPGGDTTVGQSGWRSASVTIPKAALTGSNGFELDVIDVGDAIYDSVTLIDDVRLT